MHVENKSNNCNIKLPLIDGYVYKGHLVIKSCPLCGNSHFHGIKSYQLGYMTARIKHCPDSGLEDYIIRVAGKLSKRDYDNLVKRKTPPKFRGNFNFILYSDYLDYCEKRGSWT